MSKRLVFPVLALVAMSLGASFNGCSCGGSAQIGSQEAKAPEPPPPTPPPPPVEAKKPDPPPPVQLKVSGKATMEGNKVKIPGDVEFDVDKATIKNTPQTTDILNTLAQFMKENPSVTKLRVEGHTDNSGKDEHNKKLSDDRAAAVVKWLSTNGVDGSRLKSVGFGATRPLVTNDTTEHKAMNRRTAFHVEEIDNKPVPDDSGATAGGATPAAGGTDPGATAGGATPAAAGSGTPAAAGSGGPATAAAMKPGGKPPVKPTTPATPKPPKP
jgi:OOP family OmpA-OmpF porin